MTIDPQEGIPRPRATAWPQEDPDDAEDKTIADLTADDIVIAVMGVTGVGKSEFITHFNPKPTVGHTQQSQTQEIEIYPAVNDAGGKFYLVDTPGFDDDKRTDTEVLRALTAWLDIAFKKGVRLSGMIYLHRILDPRLGGSAMQNLRMFRKLCGTDAYENVVLTTTMWARVEPEVGERRMRELLDNKEYWGEMVKGGCKIIKQADGKVAANNIVNYLIARRKSTFLKIQEEMAAGMTLDQTDAGRVVEAERIEIIAKHTKEIKMLEKEKAEALMEKDKASAEEIRKIVELEKAKVKAAEDERDRMRVNSDQLAQQQLIELRRLVDDGNRRENSLRDALNAKSIEISVLGERGRTAEVQREKDDLKKKFDAERKKGRERDRKIKSLEKANKAPVKKVLTTKAPVKTTPAKKSRK